jgi:hypothetical protein
MNLRSTTICSIDQLKVNVSVIILKNVISYASAAAARFSLNTRNSSTSTLRE